jgi:hypothetical protein
MKKKFDHEAHHRMCENLVTEINLERMLATPVPRREWYVEKRKAEDGTIVMPSPVRVRCVTVATMQAGCFYSDIATGKKSFGQPFEVRGSGGSEGCTMTIIALGEPYDRQACGEAYDRQACGEPHERQACVLIDFVAVTEW